MTAIDMFDDIDVQSAQYRELLLNTQDYTLSYEELLNNIDTLEAFEKDPSSFCKLLTEKGTGTVPLEAHYFNTYVYTQENIKTLTAQALFLCVTFEEYIDFLTSDCLFEEYTEDTFDIEFDIDYSEKHINIINFEDMSDDYRSEASKPLFSCKKTVIPFVCNHDNNDPHTHQHKFAIKIACNKFFCGDCGNTYSYYHNKKYKKQGMKIEKMGTIHRSRIQKFAARTNFSTEFYRQFVFTAPQQLRQHLLDKTNLTEFSYLIKEFLKFYIPFHDQQTFITHKNRYKGKYFNSRKLITFHAHGDSFNDTENNTIAELYKPHFNILIIAPSGKEKWILSQKELDDMLLQWTNKLKKHYPELLKDMQTANLNYRYIKTKKQMFKTIVYMTRPPDRNILKYNKQLAEFLVVDINRAENTMSKRASGWKYIDYWGNFNKQPVKLKCLCPVCNAPATRTGDPLRLAEMKGLIIALARKQIPNCDNEPDSYFFTEDDKYLIAINQTDRLTQIEVDTAIDKAIAENKIKRRSK